MKMDGKKKQHTKKKEKNEQAHMQKTNTRTH